MYTRTITLRSDQETDEWIIRIKSHLKEKYNINASESEIVRYCISNWGLMLESNKSDSSLNKSLTNT